MTYGCHNRPSYRPLFPAQNGWWLDGTTRYPKMEGVKFKMSLECNYTLTDLGKQDAKCEGCKWKR